MTQLLPYELKRDNFVGHVASNNENPRKPSIGAFPLVWKSYVILSVEEIDKETGDAQRMQRARSGRERKRERKEETQEQTE